MKHNRMNKNRIAKLFNFFSTILIFAFSLSSCKTTQISENISVHPLSLLSQDSSIYVNVPVSNHIELTSEILCAQIESLSKENAILLAKRIGNLYVGLGTVEDRARLEVSADVNIPQIAVNKVLSKKNGWKKNVLNFEKTNPESENTNSFEVYSRNDSIFQVSFPQQTILTFSQNINSLLQKYADDYKFPANSCNNWINQKSTDILFYITRPGQYLRNMIGIQARGIEYVYGNLIFSQNQKNQNANYELKLCLHLTDKRAMSAFKNLLSLSFGMMGAKINQTGELDIEISEIEVSTKQIKDLFTRDPITGKHYRVDGENIIQENKK